MNCCQCEGIETLFNHKVAARELKKYRRSGPIKTTRMLIDALKAEGVEGLALLDIGGGIGAIGHELLAAGASGATNVEASTAYIEASKEESERRGRGDRVNYQHGDFVDLAPEISPADIVTLDRVICCYPDMEALVGLSAQRAAKYYGVVYPRDNRWFNIARPVLNFFLWLSRNPFRMFVHATVAVDALVRRQGLQPRFQRNTIIWQVVVYGR
jgi:magnesium-protoporphyrin O-methyltransferase